MKNLILFCILSFFLTYQAVAQKYSLGLKTSENKYSSIPLTAALAKGDYTSMPSSASLIAYLPKVDQQGSYGTCTGWSTAYYSVTALEAMKRGYTSKSEITNEAFSAIWTYEKIKSPSDTQCSEGSYIEDALKLFKTVGVAKHKSVPYKCGATISFETDRDAGNYKIKEYKTLFDYGAIAQIKIQNIKKSISEKKPVIISFAVVESFFNAGDNWKPSMGESKATLKGNHAITIIGYDDSKYGGAFHLVNSWGESWGTSGFTWIKYNDLAEYCNFAYEIAGDNPLPNEKTTLSAQIVFKDNQGNPMSIIKSVAKKGFTIEDTEQNDEKLAVFTTAKDYSSGTRFQFYIKNEQPAYVYVIASDLTTKKVVKLFPHKTGISAYLNYKNSSVPLPSETAFIKMDNTAGKDYLCYLFSNNELNIDNLVSSMNSSSGTFSDRITSVLGSKLVNTSSINYTSSSAGFSYSTASKSNVVVPLFIVVPHK